MDTLGSIMTRCSLNAIEPGSVVILGFPYDDGKRRIGVTLTPAILLEAVKQTIRSTPGVNNPEFDIDLTSLKVLDCGDIAQVHGYLDRHIL